MMNAVFAHLFEGKNYNGSTLYAHNMGKFDIFLLLSNLLSHSQVSNIVPLRNTSGTYLGFDIKYGKGGKNTLKLRDSLNL